MAAARFQVVSVARGTHPRGVSRTESRGPRVPRTVTWRFLAANNRQVAVAPAAFPDPAACLDAIRLLRDGLGEATVALVRLPSARWLWRVRLGGADHAVAEHDYPRRVRAQLAGAAFLVLAGDADTAGIELRMVSR